MGVSGNAYEKEEKNRKGRRAFQKSERGRLGEDDHHIWGGGKAEVADRENRVNRIRDFEPRCPEQSRGKSGGGKALFSGTRWGRSSKAASPQRESLERGGGTRKGWATGRKREFRGQGDTSLVPSREKIEASPNSTEELLGRYEPSRFWEKKTGKRSSAPAKKGKKLDKVFFKTNLKEEDRFRKEMAGGEGRAGGNG